ncbi:Bacitracin synthase [Trichinella spiralis]|uniref:Bacitracin synthase n=1 Tax=Trichinella spiralis TaxID=6334 RepID=A0ABR3K7V5_TRISP
MEKKSLRNYVEFGAKLLMTKEWKNRYFIFGICPNSCSGVQNVNYLKKPPKQVLRLLHYYGLESGLNICGECYTLSVIYDENTLVSRSKKRNFFYTQKGVYENCSDSTNMFVYFCKMDALSCFIRAGSDNCQISNETLIILRSSLCRQIDACFRLALDYQLNASLQIGNEKGDLEEESTCLMMNCKSEEIANEKHCLKACDFVIAQGKANVNLRSKMKLGRNSRLIDSLEYYNNVDAVFAKCKRMKCPDNTLTAIKSANKSIWKSISSSLVIDLNKPLPISDSQCQSTVHSSVKCDRLSLSIEKENNSLEMDDSYCTLRNSVVQLSAQSRNLSGSGTSLARKSCFKPTLRNKGDIRTFLRHSFRQADGAVNNWFRRNVSFRSSRKIIDSDQHHLMAEEQTRVDSPAFSCTASASASSVIEAVHKPVPSFEQNKALNSSNERRSRNEDETVSPRVKLLEKEVEQFSETSRTSGLPLVPSDVIRKQSTHRNMDENPIAELAPASDLLAQGRNAFPPRAPLSAPCIPRYTKVFDFGTVPLNYCELASTSTTIPKRNNLETRVKSNSLPCHGSKQQGGRVVQYVDIDKIATQAAQKTANQRAVELNVRWSSTHALSERLQREPKMSCSGSTRDSTIPRTDSFFNIKDIFD